MLELCRMEADKCIVEGIRISDDAPLKSRLSIEAGRLNIHSTNAVVMDNGQSPESERGRKRERERQRLIHREKRETGQYLLLRSGPMIERVGAPGAAPRRTVPRPTAPHSIKPHLTCETSGMVAAKTATDAALYWLLGARDSSGPRDLHAVRPKLVAGFTANTACTCSGLSPTKTPYRHRVVKRRREGKVGKEGGVCI